MSGSGGGARVSGITPKLKKTIQDIREIAGQHSDEDIYAMLKECSMDPNETTQRLLHLDTFHEVKKKNARRKENGESRPSDDLGRHHDGHEQVAIGSRGNVIPRTTSQRNELEQHVSNINTHGRRSLAVSKENGISNISRSPKTENKTASQASRSTRVKSSGSRKVANGKSSLGGVLPSHVEGDDSIPNVLRSDEIRMLYDVKKQLSSSAVIISTEPKNITENGDHMNDEDPDVKSSALVLEVGDSISLVTPKYPVHGQKYWITNRKATQSNAKEQNGNPTLNMNENSDDPKIQLADSNLSGQLPLSKCSEKDNDTSDLSEAASKLNISGGRQVIFPDHLQVPESYKRKLTFGSFDSSWALEEKPVNICNGMKVDTQVDHSYPASEATATMSSTESSGSVSSTVHDPQEREDPDHLQSAQPVTENSRPLADQVPSDVVVKIEEPETISLLPNGGFVNSSAYVFGDAAHTQLQAHDNSELQGENVTASSTPDLEQNGLNQPADGTQDMVSSPLPAALLRQTFHPNFFPYGYYPQFFVPQVQQYLTHGGFPQQPPVSNVYLTSAAAAAAAGIKYPHPQQKQGSNTGTEGYNGVPSGLSTYGPYAFPYGIAPVVNSGNVTREDDDSTQSKENGTTQATDEQIDNSGAWMAGNGRTGQALQVNPFYGLAPGQGHPMIFPPVQAGFGPYPGFYHPAQAVPAPTHPQIQEPQPTIGTGEQVAHMPSALYQQQPHGAHINWNTNKQ